jgi:hypothetical protein
LTSDKHIHGNEQASHVKFEAYGICDIFIELVQHTHIFQGIRGSFEYEHVFEKNGMYKNCSISISPFERYDGMHLHTQNPNVVHYFKVRS